MHWLDAGVKKRSIEQEKKLAKDLGGRTKPASGAFDFHKGDIETDKYLIESKATEKKSISLKLEWLKKIEEEAIMIGKTPLVVLEIQGRRYFVLRESDFDI